MESDIPVPVAGSYEAEPLHPRLMDIIASARQTGRVTVDALAGIRPRQAAQRARRRLVLYEKGEPCRTPWEARESIVERPVPAPRAWNWRPSFTVPRGNSSNSVLMAVTSSGSS